MGQPVNSSPQPKEQGASFSTIRAAVMNWTRDLLIALGLAAVIIVFLYQPVKVEGTSMSPLLTDQERIFINKFVYRFEPIQRGDVVVFWYPMDRSKSFIKRVIALSGDTVEIQQGRVLVNGKELDEPYVPAPFADRSSLGPTHIPEGSFFVLGDHRNSSNDSRVFGAVPGQFIYGKAVFVYWPVERFGALPAFDSEQQ
ncbi:MAG: signal peptidase I [Acidobacteria bacterium]|nr:signal peptidase I [Acidobacteriota bacterium]